MESVEYLIVPRWLIPVAPDNIVLQDHALAVSGDRIIAVGPTSELKARYPSAETISRPNAALMPGLVNAHTHAAMTLFRGLADDLPLEQWLNEHIWPAESEFVSADFVRAGTELAVLEMLNGGTTCFADMYFFPDIVGDVSAEVGIRACVGMVVIEHPTAWARTPDEYLAKGLAVHDRFLSHPLVKTAFAPHAPYTVSNETLGRIRVLADELDCQVYIHLHETKVEIKESQERHGMRPLARLSRLGMVNPLLVGIHATQLEADEIELLSDRGASIVHCAESNMKLASGTCPVTKLRQAGVRVALGTDGAGSNNDLDMLGELRTAALLAKHATANPSALAAPDVLAMATLGGAQVLGLDSQTGSLEAGKAADLICVNLSGPHCQPVYNPLSQLAYSARASDVSDVWVAGRHLKRDGRLVAGDSGEIIERAEAWRARLQRHG